MRASAWRLVFLAAVLFATAECLFAVYMARWIAGLIGGA